MKIILFFLISIIKFYQFFISPLFPNSCRFNPSCSSYCIESLKTHGIIKGLYLSILRILKCNPWFQIKKEEKVKKNGA